MTPCIGQPVSYLRLERYNLRELPTAEHARVAEHLAQCPSCRACYERLRADDRVEQVAAWTARLSAAPAPQPRAARRGRGWLWGAGAVAASLAGLLFVWPSQPSPRPWATELKGGDLALELTRVDAQGQLLDPTRFAPGDRWKIALSCPPSLAGAVRVRAFQADERFEPLPPQSLASCGNRRLLTGAFQLDGEAAVDVCVVLGDADLDAARSPAELPEPHVCARVEPVDVGP